MNPVVPVVLTCGEMTAEIGTVEVPLRPKLTGSEFAPFIDSVKVTVAAEVDTARLGRKLAALLRQAADTFDSVEPCITREGTDHG